MNMIIYANPPLGNLNVVSTGRTFTVLNPTTEQGHRVMYAAFYKYVKPSGGGGCVAEGTMVTLADGSQKAVEALDGNESLLVWNHYTGAFDIAPMVFVDRHAASAQDVIHLYFSDGTEVKVIWEHAFWNFDLNSYVMIKGTEADQYIGHWFKQHINIPDGIGWTQVQLVDVQYYTEVIAFYSPVTFGHLNFYVNGMLSMPGDTEGLINIFLVDSDTLQYDQAAYAADIALYGLFTYADFEGLIPVEIFDAFNVQYLSISLGKELITWDRIEWLIEYFAAFWADEEPTSNTGNPGNQGQGNGASNGNVGKGQGHNNGKGKGQANGNAYGNRL